MSYTNFNRQTGFTKLEFAFMTNVIRFFQDHTGFDEFYNKLCGLYDGFLYSDLMDLCKQFLKDNETKLKEEGILVQAHRRKEDLRLIIEKIQELPVISQDEAQSIV